jgi:hypothetical protein
MIAFAAKNVWTSGPEIMAATRIAHIDRTGYSSQLPGAAASHGSRYGIRPPASCSVPRSGTMSV